MSSSFLLQIVKEAAAWSRTIKDINDLAKPKKKKKKKKKKKDMYIYYDQEL